MYLPIPIAKILQDIHVAMVIKLLTAKNVLYKKKIDKNNLFQNKLKKKTYHSS